MKLDEAIIKAVLGGHTVTLSPKKDGIEVAVNLSDGAMIKTAVGWSQHASWDENVSTIAKLMWVAMSAVSGLADMQRKTQFEKGDR